MGRIYKKEEFLELFDENLNYGYWAEFEFVYKGFEFVIVPKGMILDGYTGTAQTGMPIYVESEEEPNFVQTMGGDILFTGKVGDPHWILYNYMLDGKPFIDRIEDCILEAY